jgi:hypothetical protein
LLDGAAWEAARPTVCRTLAKSQNAAEEIGRLSNRLDHAFRSVAGNLPKNASVRIEQNGVRKRHLMGLCLPVLTM